MTTLTRSWIRVLGLFLAFVLIAAACGDDGGGETSGDDDTTVTDDDASGDDDGTGDDDMGDDDGTGDDDMGDDDMGDMTPVMGGEISYLLEAESDTWDIPGANCAVSCISVMRTVTDPLTIIDANGDVQPWVLESFESNADFTEYTLVVRDGITFHDGTAVDGAAVQRNLQEMAAGALQGQVLQDLSGGADGIELVDAMTVKVSFDVPYSVFPRVISERTGYMIAPAYWDDPDRGAALMIGSGPFEMTEWSRGEQTVVERNPNYWRTDANGVQLPYLDKVTFRPVPDVSTRRATMESVDADVNMDSFGENREFWETTWIDDGNHVVDPAPDREVTYLLINNGAPPFDNADLRKALALCTDREEYIEFRAPGNVIADGPFAEGTIGYLEDTGFPQFDPDAGNTLLDEIGRPDVINYGTTNVPSNLLTAELFADMWNTNCGLNVQIDQFDQSELITKAITGAFEVFLWRNHGQGDPGVELVWWHSRHAEGIALNFGRIRDPQLDQLLLDGWATDDPTEKQAIAEDINRLFGENVYNLWLNTTVWQNVYQSDVHGVGVNTMLDGSPGQTAIAGRTWVNEAWKES